MNIGATLFQSFDAFVFWTFIFGRMTFRANRLLLIKYHLDEENIFRAFLIKKSCMAQPFPSVSIETNRFLRL